MSSERKIRLCKIKWDEGRRKNKDTENYMTGKKNWTESNLNLANHVNLFTSYHS